MDPFNILAICAAIVVFCVIPILIIFYVNRWLTNNLGKRIALTISILLFLVYAFGIYRSFYPSDGYFIRNFEDYAQLKLPDSVKIVDKESSSSIFDFGGSSLCSRIELNDSDYNEFIKKIDDSKFIQTKGDIFEKELENVLSRSKNLKIEKIFVCEKPSLELPGMELSIYLLSDHKSIIIYYCDW